MGRVCHCYCQQDQKIEELTSRALKRHQHFSETGTTGISPTELIAMLINEDEVMK